VNKKIAVASYGHPLNYRTWSGTPFHICNELKKRNLLGATIDIEGYAGGFTKKFYTVISRLIYYGSFDAERGMFQRKMRADNLRKEILENNVKQVLHMGLLGLPYNTKDLAVKNYMYCDYAWNLWVKQSSLARKCSKKLLEDAEVLERDSFRQMDHIFTTSRFLKDNIAEHYSISEDKITVAGTGRGKLEPYSGEKNYKNGKILFVAKDGLFVDKGGLILVNAFEIAKKKNPALILNIVGDISSKKYVRNIPGVNVHGFVPFDQLQKFFNESSLYVMPAVKESWGLVYLEAMSCKMPVIGFNKNSIPEIICNGEFGFAIDEENPELLSDMILEAFSDPERLKGMGEKGQDYVLKNFTWERTVDKMLDKIS
jgi:glycosyltransferase involved in cell wall biosynthesis